MLGTVASNPATTAITQAMNNQPVRPMENFTWKNLTPGLVGSVVGPAAVGAARIGATMVNAPFAGVQAITGGAGAPLIAIEGQAFGRATEVLSGVVSGVTSGSLGAAQASRAQTGGAATGAQNLQSFSDLVAPWEWGTFGGGATGSYSGAAAPRPK